MQDLKALREVMTQDFLLLIEQCVRIGECLLILAEGVLLNEVFTFEEVELKQC